MMGEKEIATPLQSQDWFQQMIENLQNLLVEGEFTARFTLIQIYHTTGAMIAEHESKVENLIEETARALGRSTRWAYQCRQFYEKFPNLDKLPDGKAISWHRITNELLPEHKEPKKKPDLKARIKEWVKTNVPDKKQRHFAMQLLLDWENEKGGL